MSGNPFKPAWWLRNSHLQTIWPVVCRRSIKLALKRERLDLPDGDFIDLDWIEKQPTEGPLIIILHGLEGSINSHYARGMLNTIYSQGWRGLFMHFRGCSGEPNRLPRGYHSGDTEDFNFVVHQLLTREPNLAIGAVGYSLGGNVLLKWLGETGATNPLKAAIAISVPFELHKAAARIQLGFSQFYQWYFIKCLRQRLSHKFKNVKIPLDDKILYKVKTMVDYDNHITAPLHGFSNANEYYAIASSRQYLRRIQVPTLIVHAKDDPFMTEDVIPQPSEISPKVELEITENGGHVGFVSGKFPWKAEYWLENRAAQFFRKFFKS